MRKKIEENMIGAKVVAYKRDDKGEKTDELVCQGVYLGTVLELAQSTSAVGTTIASFSVGLIKTSNNGVVSFVKLPLEILEFPK